MTKEFLLGPDAKTAWLQHIAQPSEAPAPDSGFFRSARWIRNYVEEWHDEAVFGCFPEVGAILGRRRATSKLGQRYWSIALNRSEDDDIACFPFEENGFFGRPADDFEQRFDLLLKKLKPLDGWLELQLDALNEVQAKSARAIAAAHSMIAYPIKEAATYWVNLKDIRELHGGDFLKSRSSNTRQQLRRAKRLAEQTLGPVLLRRSENLPEALDWLKALGKLHQDRWGRDKPLEGFNNPRFPAFFEKITADCWNSGEVAIFRLQAGDRALAYLYNFLSEGRLYFIMSGIDYAGTEALKPGMLAHWLAIERTLEEGYSVYDFLNGTNRYKESLCTDKAMTEVLVLRRPSALFKIEHMLLRAKRYASKRLSFEA